MNEQIEQCGFCGRYFKGNTFLTEEEVGNISKKYLNEILLGYCPDAQYELNPENYHHQVTRDMAIDAGDLSLEGQWI